MTYQRTTLVKLIRPTLLAATLLLTATPSQAQATDSLPVYNLATLSVTAPSNDEVILPINAPLEKVSARDLARFDSQSPLAALSALAGVRFEQRSPGSYRLSIRGSALRAPFGVRNVKVYWNGFPLTEPGGDTPLNVLDVANMPSIVIFKGPAGSLYGSGTGGAMIINSDLRGRSRSDNLQTEAGSYGYGRLAWGHQRRRENGDQHTLRLAHQRTDGYRDHSQFNRSTAEVYVHRPGRQTGSGLKFHALASNLNYEIPGGLNPEQFATNPRQARPGSSDTKAGIHQQFLLMGVTHYSDLTNNGWKQQSRAYATGNLFENPFNVDFKRETNLGVGLRSVVSRSFALTTSAKLDVIAGLEAQLAHKAALNYGTNAGAPGALNFADDILSRQGLLFGQGTLHFGPGWRAELSLSAQRLSYRIDRSFNADGATGITDAGFPVVIAPRLSLAKAFRWGTADYAAFLAYGRAYSPPTLREFRTNEGSLNADLRPERGDALEIGFQRNSLLGFNLSLNTYVQLLDQSITTFQDSSGVQLFRNAGGNRQFGLEVTVSRELINAPAIDQFIKSLHLRLAYTYQEGRYRDYRTAAGDFSDQPLPGLSPRTLDAGITLRTRQDYELRLGLYTAARTPLNDANEVFADSFHLLRLRIGKSFQWVGRRSLGVYLGVNNLLDERYSLGYDLNPQFGNRYFQPAAGRNFYLGVRYSASGLQ